MDVTVTSAKALSYEQRSRLSDKLAAVYGKKIVITEKIDPSVLGGVKLTCRDKQLDGTVRTKLDNIRSSMKNIIA